MNSGDRDEQKAQYLRAIFDAIPMPTFIVDEDVRIEDFNTAAEEFLGSEPSAALHRRAGEALHCIYAEDAYCGGANSCGDCVIRKSVGRAIRGGTATRQLHQGQLQTRRGNIPVDFLVTANLLPYTEPPRVILILEDVTRLSRFLRSGKLRHA